MQSVAFSRPDSVYPGTTDHPAMEDPNVAVVFTYKTAHDDFFFTTLMLLDATDGSLHRTYQL